MLEKKILIAVPTFNRSDIVIYLLNKISGTVNTTHNLYLGLFDSSSDGKTKEIIKPFLNEKIFYKEYDSSMSDEKIIDILMNHAPYYDYIWFCSDRKVLKLDSLLPLIERDINEGYDLLFFTNYNIKGTKKVITDRREMGVRFFEVLNMAKTIIGKNMFGHMTNPNVYKKYFDSHLLMQSLMMDYIGCYDFKAIQYNLRDQDVAETGAIPFVHEWGNTVVWQWSKSWCDTVDKLPSSFNEYKEDIIHGNFMFSFKKVLARRATGNEYRIKDIIEYKPYIKRVRKNLLPLYMAKCLPVPLLRFPYKVYKTLKTKMSNGGQ